RAAADDVAGGVNRNIQLRRAHQTHHIFAPLAIGFAVSDATDSALRVLAKFRQGFEVFIQARAVNAQPRLRSKRDTPGGNRAYRSQQNKTKCASIHFLQKIPEPKTGSAGAPSELMACRLCESHPATSLHLLAQS